MRNTTLTEKLLIASFSISIVIIIIVSSITFSKAKYAILDRTFQQLTSVRIVKSNLINQFFNNAINEIQLVNKSREILNIASIVNNTSDTLLQISRQKISATPFVDKLRSGIYSGIYIIGNNGNYFELKTSTFGILDQLTKLSLPKKFTNTSNGINIFQTNNYNQQKNDNYIYISSYLKDINGNMLGHIVFAITHKDIDLIMLEDSDMNGFGISGESYLVGNDFLMRSTSRFDENSIMKTIVKTDASKRAIKGESGTSVIKDYRGIKVLSSYGQVLIPDLHWNIIVEIDFKETTIPISKIRYQIIFISIFIFLIVLLVTIVFSRRITFPIQRLNRAAKQISTGNFEIEIENDLNDEIGDLTRTFNKMSKKLKESSDELEAERKRSMGALIDGQENERHRISRELHDGLGQLLIGLKMKFESCKNDPEIGIERSTQMNDMSKLFDRTIDETRRISNNLAPASLSEFGLRTALRRLCNDISETSKININMKNELGNNLLPVKLQIYIFRMIQEMLTNILKHSKANNVEISLTSASSNVVIKVVDDGIGFDYTSVKKQANSHGLNNILDRVNILDGYLKIRSSPSNGTAIKIVLSKKP